MGAGKSTIGRFLANTLNLPFNDSDKEIEDRAGADIAWIFDKEGEEGFRLREANVLADLLSGPPLVLATGGGIVIKPENRALLCSAGTVVYLYAKPELLFKRIQKDKKRPLLQTDHPRQTMIDLFNHRDPLYREVADHIVTTGTRGPKSVVQDIIKLLD